MENTYGSYGFQLYNKPHYISQRYKIWDYTRGTEIIIKRLKPYTAYKVEIETEDGSSQKSNKAFQLFKTKEALGKHSR